MWGKYNKIWNHMQATKNGSWVGMDYNLANIILNLLTQLEEEMRRIKAYQYK